MSKQDTGPFLYDLRGVYAAFLDLFVCEGTPWFERPWGSIFTNITDFLSVSMWDVMILTDKDSFKAHVVTNKKSIKRFLFACQTRYQLQLEFPTRAVTIKPYETSLQSVYKVEDMETYEAVLDILPVRQVELMQARVGAGDHLLIKSLWNEQQRTFLSIDFEWWEKDPSVILEFGFAAVRCGHLKSQCSWPPNPDQHYIRGHYAISEHVSNPRIQNTYSPNQPWHYCFGETKVVSQDQLQDIVVSFLSAFSSGVVNSISNNLVIIGHNVQHDMQRISELGITWAPNILTIDTAQFERQLFIAGQRDKEQLNPDRKSYTTLNLGNLLRTLRGSILPPPSVPADKVETHVRMQHLPGCSLHNAGNDAFMTLFAFQLLAGSTGMTLPLVKKRVGYRPEGS